MFEKAMFYLSVCFTTHSRQTRWRNIGETGDIYRYETYPTHKCPLNRPCLIFRTKTFWQLRKYSYRSHCSTCSEFRSHCSRWWPKKWSSYLFPPRESENSWMLKSYRYITLHNFCLNKDHSMKSFKQVKVQAAEIFYKSEKMFTKPCLCTLC